MKFYGIYRGDKRIKRYGLHKTAEKLRLKFYDCQPASVLWHYSSIFCDRLLMERGYSIKVAIEE